MSSSPDWPPGLVDRLGPIQVVATVGGRGWRVHSPTGMFLVKKGPAVRDEADGLERLQAAGTGLRVPSVLYCDDSHLATEWIEASGPTPAAEGALGAGLAALHAVLLEGWGGGSGWIGECRVDPAPAVSAAAFYSKRLWALARLAGLALAPDLQTRLAGLIPPGGPVLLHGDLWWGNVLWGSDGRPALIDPSVHGGHPEEDLAMLALFGSVPARVLDAYRSARRLDEGWEERVRLWQLYPLLVHAVLFGGSYAESARQAASRYGLLS